MSYNIFKTLIFLNLLLSALSNETYPSSKDLPQGEYLLADNGEMYISMKYVQKMFHMNWDEDILRKLSSGPTLICTCKYPEPPPPCTPGTGSVGATRQTNYTSGIHVEMIPGFNVNETLKGEQLNQNITSFIAKSVDNYINTAITPDKTVYNLMSDTVYSVTGSYISSLSQGQTTPDESIYQVPDSNIQLVLHTQQKYNQTQSQQDTDKVIEDIKSQVINITQGFVNYSVLNNSSNDQVQVSNKYFSVQITNSSMEESTRAYSVKNNLTIINSTSCLTKIREYLGLPVNASIPISQIEWNSSLATGSFPKNVTTTEVNYNFYNPKTGEKLDVATICKDSPVEIKHPINPTSLGINMTLYNQYSEKGINIYNSKDDFYINRCFQYFNDTSDADVPLPTRRTLFPNVSLSCGKGCSFKSIENEDYMVCKCDPSNKTLAWIENPILDAVISVNLDVFLCYVNAFSSEIIPTNCGFYMLGFLYIAAIVFIIVYQIIDKNGIYKHLKDYLQNDGTFFSNKIFNFRVLFQNVAIPNPNPPRNEDNEAMKPQEQKTESKPPKVFGIFKKQKSIVGDYRKKLASPEKVDIPLNNNNIASEEGIQARGEDIVRSSEKKEEKKDVIQKKPTLNESKVKYRYDNLESNINTNKLGAKPVIEKGSDDDRGISSVKPESERSGKELLNRESLHLELEELEDKDKLTINQNNPIASRKRTQSIHLEQLEEAGQPPVSTNTKKQNYFERKKTGLIKQDLFVTFTLMDYSNMTYDEHILYDNRSFWRHYFDCFKLTHSIWRTFFLRSIVHSRVIRIVVFFIHISMSFTLNALFYTDSYVEQRNLNPESSSKNNFLWTLENQLAKSIYSALFSAVPNALLNLLLIVPEQYYNELNEAMLSCNSDEISLANKEYQKKMMPRYVSFIAIAWIAHFVFWYYVCAFCAVYIKSSTSWLSGGFISLIITLCLIEVAIPMCHTLVRTLAKRNPNYKIVKWSYILMFKLF